MDTFEVIDWQSPKSYVLLNPRMPTPERESLKMILERACTMPAHLWLTTSGSSGTLKCVALSKTALLSSAEAVNKHLKSTESDIWLNPLPHFHVGGLGILARGYLSGAAVKHYHAPDNRWDPTLFLTQATLENATLTALVPTQVFDLTARKMRAPKALRAVVVGGGALNDTVYQQAVKLGWKLLPSYGLSECASQVATASIGSESCLSESKPFPRLTPLDHVKLAVNEQGLLQVSSPSLLTAYAYPDLFRGSCSLIDPKIDGWLTTEDRVILENGCIRTISRGEHFVKIGGESVDLLRLDKILEAVRLDLDIHYDMALFAFPDSRLGHVIHLAVAVNESFDPTGLVKSFNEQVFPFERIRSIHDVSEIPRSPLKKVLRHLLP